MTDKQLQELIIENKSLKAQIKELKKRKKYGLVRETRKTHPEKQEQVVRDCQKSLPVLTEISGKAILTDLAQVTHVLIEGDNYHALSSLYYSHKGKIDVIYIDPPYNTGNKDFIYNDKFVDKEDQFRHSKWLNFMSVRLKLAKELLSKKGVIFMSIDDNEFAQLKILCDEIFGDDNFIANLIWHKKLTGGYDNKYVNTQHEYVFVYARNEKYFSLGKVKKVSKYKLVDKFGRKYKWDSLRNIGGLTYSPSLDYPIMAPDGTEIWPLGEKGKAFRLWSKDRVEKEKDSLQFKKDKKTGERRIYKRVYASDGGLIPASFLDKEIVGANTTSSAEMKDLFGSKIFDYTKPSSLINFLISLFPNPNAIILDFFAGSGTTGHAVAQLNAQDGGNRQAILMTNNEGNICTDVTYPRLSKAINGYTNAKGKEIVGLGGNLKYYKTDFVPNNTTDSARRKLVHGSLAMLTLAEQAYMLVRFVEFARYLYEGESAYMLIIFEPSIISECCSELTFLANKKIIVYQFTHNEILDKTSYSILGQSIIFKALPDILLKAYKKVFDLTFSAFKKI